MSFDEITLTSSFKKQTPNLFNFIFHVQCEIMHTQYMAKCHNVHNLKILFTLLRCLLSVFVFRFKIF